MKGEAKEQALERQLAEAQALAHIGSFELPLDDPDQTIWSEELFRIFGLEPGSILPPLARRLEMVHPSDRDFVQRALERHEPFEGPIRIRRPDGEERILSLRMKYSPPEGRLPGRMIGTCQDVTDQTRADRARQEAQAHFETAFENAPIGMAVTDAADLAFVQVNRALADMLGYTRSELLAMTVTDITHPEDVDIHVAEAQRLIDGDSASVTYEKRYVRADGAMVIGCCTAALVRDERGRPLHYIGQIEDITERRSAEDALHESRERLEQILENSETAIYLKDLDGRYLLINGPAAALVGLSVEEALGHTDAELLPPELAEALRQNDLRVLRAGAAITFEEILPTPGGEVRMLSRKFVLRDSEREPYATGGISTDITERVRVEEQNRRLEAALDQSRRVEMVGRLAGGIAHDFNNLLAVILNYAALIEDESDGEVFARDLGEIRRAAECAASLTRQLLDYSRRGVVERRLLALNDVVAGHRDLIAGTLGAAIELEYDLQPDLWPLRGDRSQLEGILLNLTLNARDAMSPGDALVVRTANVTVDAQRAALMAPHVKPGRFVALVVTDTGHGMHEDVKEHAFDPFFTTKAKAQGTGLGLASVYGMVRQADGHVELASAPGKGTTVSVFLPAAEVAADEEPGAGAPDPAPAVRARGRGESILVVEDDDAVRRLVDRILSRSGYSVSVAAGPAQALQIHADAAHFDLLLTDLVMPGMSGPHLADELGAARPELRVLYMSGYGHDVLTRHGVGETGRPLVKKPFTARDLLDRVSQALAADRASPV